MTTKKRRVVLVIWILLKILIDALANIALISEEE